MPLTDGSNSIWTKLDYANEGYTFRDGTGGYFSSREYNAVEVEVRTYRKKHGLSMDSDEHHIALYHRLLREYGIPDDPFTDMTELL